MSHTVLVLAIVAAVGVGIDRLLLRAEAQGWINWRRRGPSRGAATYHTLELMSIFDPSVESVIEARYSEQRNEDDCGEPPGPLQ